MTLPVPQLDDRTFLDLVTQARERIRQSCPTWTDLSVSDPGVALLEAFAYLTEVMIYRLNQVPEKAYVSFLNLLGVSRHPPAAAYTDVTFTRTGTDTSTTIPIPAGTRVNAARGTDPAPVVFTTTEPVRIPSGATDVAVRMHHCELIEGELLGTGTGQPGLVLHAAKAPLVTTTEALDLLLGVEVPAGSVELGAAAREYDGKTYEIWQPVTSFAGNGRDAKVYQLDRFSGTVTFPPALDLRTPAPQGAVAIGDGAVGAVPPAGRQIRLWYRTGGGATGNVAAGTLTGLRDPIPGVKVNNAEPARGGRDLEPLDAALLRGPYEFFSLRRAVTARDYEILATAGSSAVARARAFTRAEVFSFAKPGEVEVVLVPYVPDQARPAGRLTVDTLRAHEIEEARAATQTDLAQRRALGTSCRTSWAKYKSVSVQATVVVRAEEDTDAVSRRIHDRLYQTLSPLPTALSPDGWPFGEPLRASNVYRMLEQAEPGVRYVDSVRFVLDEAPDQAVKALAADRYQSQTWYAGGGGVLFRSSNAGQGWEPVGRFGDGQVTRVVPAPAPVRPGIAARPGSVAVVVRGSDGTSSAVHLSTDLGETWTQLCQMDQSILDLDWLDRDGTGIILLATDTGLFELALVAGSVPTQTLVYPADPDRGFYAVRAFVSDRGAPGVAVAAQAQYGVYLSTDAGRRNTFQPIGLANVDTRVLDVQYDGPATVLWTGTAEANPQAPGQGCYRTRLYETDVRWQQLNAGWLGGTCRDLALTGSQLVAGTQSGGVVRLDTTAQNPTWQSVAVNCGLPLRDRTRFVPVETVAAGAGQLLTGGASGVYRSTDAVTFTVSANQSTVDLVTVPDTWLLCSGQHAITVVRDGAAPGQGGG